MAEVETDIDERNKKIANLEAKLDNTQRDYREGALENILKITAGSRSERFVKEFTRQKPKILLVDDNDINRKVASSIMIKSGCKVEEAFDGFHAIEKVEKEDFDLIFTDFKCRKWMG